uniref:type I-MYXAN CRISPR-associated protein Cas6/Cmx6 n=1 Tax=Candidatus Electrothrix sp. TaxID=2170559 RepID=UPI004056E6F0
MNSSCTANTIVWFDLHFQLSGKTIPVDHGYSLFSAISRCLPKFHAAQDVRLALIRGRYIGDGLLQLLPGSRITFRLASDKVAQYINLAGKNLDLDGHQVRVGVPGSQGLVPATVLYAHLVTTRNGLDQERFEAEIRRQLDVQGCQGRMTIGKRRTFAVHSKQVVGYSLLVSELTAEESITLQEQGLGGRQKMGCGFFQPWKG